MDEKCSCNVKADAPSETHSANVKLGFATRKNTNPHRIEEPPILLRDRVDMVTGINKLMRK